MALASGSGIDETAAENIHLAYVTNFVLIASFLGIGLGFLIAGSAVDAFRWSPVFLGVLVAFVYIFPVKLQQLSGPNLYFTNKCLKNVGFIEAGQIFRSAYFAC